MGDVRKARFYSEVEMIKKLRSEGKSSMKSGIFHGMQWGRIKVASLKKENKTVCKS